MSCKSRKQRSAFDQVSKFHRGRIVTYRDCGLSFRKIGSRVGRNQTTVTWICDLWIQEGTMDRRGRSHPPQCTTSREDRHIVRMAVCAYHSTPLTAEWSVHKTSIAWSTLDAKPQTCLRRKWCDGRRVWVAEWNEVVFTDESRICLQHHDGRIRVWRHRGERMPYNCVMHRPAPGIMVWGGIEYHSRTPLIRIQGLITAIFQQDNAPPHVALIVQRPFVNHQIELLPWPARSPDLSPIENSCTMVAQRLTQVTPPAATPDQLWQRVEAAWSAVPQEHIQSL
ncbi:transposable element Tcb1 transposase [Trichonephila clavipes]|nr:transposable element Tcb1 transposase [Trichonephila clavipes]